MLRVTDQEYLRNEQYRDASNLNARSELHRRFSTNAYGWHRWVLDRIHLPPSALLLELGCGPGDLWREKGARVPQGWQVTLADLSLGMLQEARQNLGGSLGEFTFAEADAQAIPFQDASFDGVIANHMLYHVPDREKALAEIRRVLRPGGRFYAATNGQAHMREVREWVQRWVPDTQRWSFAFSLDTGQEQLERWFPSVILHRYEDALVVTEAEPLIAYVRSGYAGTAVSGDRLAELSAFVRQELATHGAIRITKDTGLFEAWGGEGGG